VANGQFSLRLNGKKTALLPQPAAFVAAALRYTDWEYSRRVELGASRGDSGVILGRPNEQERFPGDGSGRRRLPNPPRVPNPVDNSGIEREPKPTADQVALSTALPEGETRGPVSGHLYFAHKGKTRSIRKVELLYNGPNGTATLPLL
jgi:hypothetical protein